MSPKIHVPCACSIDGCIKPVMARGWCRMHYYRWRRTGTTDLKTIEAKFWENVSRDGPVVDLLLGRCWDWTGCMFSTGYGRLQTDHTIWYAHRFSWEMHNGKITDDAWVLHKCDRPSCIRPSHLFLGDTRSNTNDMVSKGRQAKGEKCHTHKLTESDVTEIRRRYVPFCPFNGRNPLASEFNVSTSTINGVIHRKSWKHLP